MVKHTEEMLLQIKVRTERITVMGVAIYCYGKLSPELRTHIVRW